MLFSKKLKAYSSSESGRSMIEMLGVLAIVGVLSIAGIAGYEFAVLKFRVNEIINELNGRAISVSSLLLNDKHTYVPEDVIKDGFGDTLSIGYGVESVLSDRNSNYFEISVMNVPDKVCVQLLKSYENPIMIFADDVSYNNDTSICHSESGSVEMDFIYRNDLGEHDKCSARGYFGEEDFKCHCSGNTYIDPDNPLECLCPAGHIWSEDENTCIESICEEGYFESSQYGCISCTDTRAVTVTTARQQKSCNACPNRYHDRNYQYCINEDKCKTGDEVISMWGDCGLCSSTGVIYPGVASTGTAAKDSCLACKSPYEREIVDGVCVPKGAATGTNGYFWYWTPSTTLAKASCSTTSVVDVRSNQQSGPMCAKCVDESGNLNRKVVDGKCVKTSCGTNEFQAADGSCHTCDDPLSLTVSTAAACSVCSNRTAVTQNGTTYCQLSACPTGTHVLLDDGSCYPCTLDGHVNFTTDSEAEKAACAACIAPNTRHVTGNNKCIKDSMATYGRSFYNQSGANWYTTSCGIASCYYISTGSVEAEYCLACNNQYIYNGTWCCLDNKSCSSDQFSAASICKDCSLMEKVRIDTDYQKNSCNNCSSTNRFWIGEYCYRCDSIETPDVTTDEERQNCESCVGLRTVSSDNKCVLIQ